MQTEHRMQLICDGALSKRDVMEESLTQYKEVFIKAKREWDTITQVRIITRSPLLQSVYDAFADELLFLICCRA